MGTLKSPVPSGRETLQRTGSQEQVDEHIKNEQAVEGNQPRASPPMEARPRKIIRTRGIPVLPDLKNR